MRILFSKNSKKRILFLFKEKNKCQTLEELAHKLNINKKTLENWFYSQNCTIPYDVCSQYLSDKDLQFSKKEDNWGQVEGGIKGYQTIISRYGSEEVRKSSARGGRTAAQRKDKLLEGFQVQLSEEFLELYGALLGDGWLCTPHNAHHKWMIGICGHLSKDANFIRSRKSIIARLFHRKGYINLKKDTNTIEFVFGHKGLFRFLNEQLKFPAGRKENLQIPPQIYSLGYDKVKHVIQGIFDTDGSFYLDRNRAGVPSYPCISIHMKEPLLMNQIAETLSSQGFKVIFEKSNGQIKLKGKKQLFKWMNEIGSSNPKHLNKIALVAQPG